MYMPLLELLHNILGDLENPKKRRVKRSNVAFERKVGRHGCCVDFLKASGFLEREDPEEGALWGRQGEALLLQ